MTTSATSPESYYEMFVQGFLRMQGAAAAINRHNGFTKEDDLIDEFEADLVDMGIERGFDAEAKYKPLVDAYRNARIGLKLMLITGELGETLEWIRKSHATEPDKHCPDFTNEEVELADVVLRVMNYATDRKLRVAGAIVAKNFFNIRRADHQPENRAESHGKKF